MTSWLIDKSAAVRLVHSPDRDDWLGRLGRGVIRVCTPTLLELGYSARNANELHRDLISPPVSLLLVERMTPAAEDRALEVLGLLADRGQHRAPSIPDLLVAAIAELANLTVLHVDKDFELIAGITGQPTERLRLPEP